MNEYTYYKIKITFVNASFLGYILILYDRFYLNHIILENKMMTVSFLYPEHVVDHILESKFILDNSLFHTITIYD